ncbi:UDP-glycosyltransferase 87A2-like isoform X3 [Ziziphus jujuba]|nr:UDP-glycosyltransferase 87A2-like isoform X3 [Ziziphus jujuba]
MDTIMAVGQRPTKLFHVVAVPYPGRGHVNPIMNFCKLLASKRDDLIITFVVTEEWLGFLGCDPKPNTIRFRTIPNVVPSELIRGADFAGFYEAVMTKMEAPFEKLLNEIAPPATTVIADTELPWAVTVGNRRNIPVASVWTMSASIFLHGYIRHFVDQGDEQVLNIPGISSTLMPDLQKVGRVTDERVSKLALECVSQVRKAQYLLLTSFYELEPQAIDTLQAQLPFPLYPVGPAIPYLELENTSSTSPTDYLQWLNSQPPESVLYISLGSFLSVSSAQMDEIAVGLRSSGVRFLWVARAEACRLKESCGDMGLVVPWCEQLKVLCHSSVGGFWSHCGWNSTLEAVFAGVPMLTFPLFLDQFPNSSQIVHDWKIGWKVERDGNWMNREEIAELVQSFMNLESNEGKEIRKRARELSEVCHRAIGKSGSSETNLHAFIRDITLGQGLN